MSGLVHPIMRALEGLKTLYLFSKSDLLVITTPAIAVSLILTNQANYSILSVLTAVFWIQIHLLTFQIKNQIIGIPEDTHAKPHRPLPSGRITLRNANRLYILVFGTMWMMSLYTGTAACTLIYSIAITVYNEGGWVRVAWTKNVLGGIGLACYCWGGTFCMDPDLISNSSKFIAVFMMGAIFATTGHAQDFRDITADKLSHRKTLPILFLQFGHPNFARWSLSALMAIWTMTLLYLWNPPVLVSILFAGVAARSAGGFIVNTKRDERFDGGCYEWYGVWLLGVNVLPIFARLRGEF